jgi:hypothetical protein
MDDLKTHLQPSLYSLPHPLISPPRPYKRRIWFRS